MGNDMSAFMRNSDDLFVLSIGGKSVTIDPIFSINCMEQYLSFIDSGCDYRTAVAKLAYFKWVESKDTNNTFTESDFIGMSAEDLERLAATLLEQAVDSEKDDNAEKNEDVFKALYIASNTLRMEMTETTRKVTAPFMKAQRQTKKLQHLLGLSNKIQSMMPPFGVDNISAALDISNSAAYRDAMSIQASLDMDALSASAALNFDIQDRINSVLPHLDFYNENIFAINDAVNHANKYSHFVNTMLSPGVTSMLEQFATRVSEVMNPLGDVISAISENFFRPLNNLWLTFDFDDVHQKLLERDRKGIEQILFETKWFMFSADVAVGDFVFDVVDILRNKRIKNHDKHIDAIVFKYITHDTIDGIARDWKTRQISKHIKRILRESLIAYKQKKYASTIILLSNLWQGIVADLYDSTGYRTDKKSKEQFAQIVAKEDAPQVISQFFNKYIWKDCRSPDGVIDGIPGRHAIAHGWLMDAKYPSRKTALNAILFTHFLLGCYPTEP